MGALTSHSIMATLEKGKLRYDLGKDLVPVAVVGSVPLVWVVHAVAAGEDAEGAGGLREGQSRQAQLRLLRRRRPAAHVRGALPPARSAPT